MFFVDAGKYVAYEWFWGGTLGNIALRVIKKW